MKNHVWRPLFLAIACVALLLVVRSVYVPDDFGVYGQNFTYGYHRLSNIQEWKDFKIKYRGKEYCRECHEEKVEANLTSHHSLLECENCHGPAVDHPEDPELLPIESSRLLCLRCHAFLPYPQSNRADMPSVDTDNHNPGENCIGCHNPHHPDLEEM
ncbi:MAG: cytochrome C [Desulfobulbaceae bacterium]|uniref:Cytochrome C n=1 Tax=Candidatus Desulfobia pelagia TaxID=2841692 RepID=A0A8J6NCR8_9BACT|nr:cytochrome C [Candidatus Desulfobia pelagia]